MEAFRGWSYMADIAKFFPELKTRWSVGPFPVEPVKKGIMSDIIFSRPTGSTGSTWAT
jgi:hypothetical protein